MKIDKQNSDNLVTYINILAPDADVCCLFSIAIV